MKELICEICGKNTLRRFQLEDGKMVCEQCNESLQIKNVLDIEVPDAIKWVGKCAKMGVGKNGLPVLLFIIPDDQRPFFKHKEKYVVVVRKL